MGFATRAAPTAASLSDDASCATPRVTCPICNEICDRHSRYNLTSCLHCNHVFQTDLAITVAYDANYAHQYDSLPVREMSKIRWDFIRSYLHLPDGSRILDVGYGNGAFLRYARGAGMKIYGIDVHSEDFGIPVVDFNTPLVYDLVCFFDSLEHFPSFAPIFQLSARNVVISIPNTPDCLLTTPTDWRHFKPGEHLHYFSRQSLTKLMASWGFARKIVDAFPEDILRGKLDLNGQMTNNIYTAIYTRC
jgi:SAM-dependent methyltransferase